MGIYTVATGIVAGICIGLGILFLFVGLRRKANKNLSLTFAMFALSYASHRGVRHE
jgi:formate/nitrite transporter FocA (FNT family)